MIERQLKTRILKLISNIPSVAILGARQAGKTTLAKMIMPELKKETLYLDLENPVDIVKFENAVPFISANQEKCLIVDEVQRKPELFPILRSMIDQHRKPGRFLLLGSASPNLLKLSSETLAGRIVYTELTPFNALEIPQDAPTSRHWIYGGFPEPFLMQDDEIRQEWFNSFLITYIERDLRLLGLSPTSMNILKFVTMLAHSHGQLINRSTFARSLDVSVNSISSYLHYLENTFFIRNLPPFHKNLKKRLVKSPKIYVRDTGLLHHLLRIKDYNTLIGHPILGNSWEGYVIEQIISVLGNKFEYSFYRSQDGSECDLVISEKFTPIAAVEIKFSSAPKKSKGLTVALQDIQAPQNFIIVPDCAAAWPLAENLTVCNLKQFFQLLQLS